MSGQRVLLGVVMCMVMAQPRNVGAFAEDICFPSGGGPAQNCSTLPGACLPVGTDSLTCRVAASAAFVLEGTRTSGARSTVHADVTHLLAQAVGFSPEDAYWMAAYDEVADYGSFEPYDQDGHVYGDGGMRTAQLNGFVRTNLPSGGMLFHFHAPYNGGAAQPLAGVDGLHPDVSNPQTEPFLAHLRAWAVAGAGQTPAQCAAGLTVQSAQSDYALGDSCYQDNGAPAVITGAISAVASGDIPFTLLSGLQVIAAGDAGVTLSSHFDELVSSQPARVADARLGIYLHSLADRVSHHRCDDRSVLTGPVAGPDGGWRVDMTNADCAQGYHALRHLWETGVDFSLLTATDRTTLAVLPAIYDELLTSATARGVTSAGAAARKDALMTVVATALQTPDAQGRILALAAVACSNGWAPFPGMAGCPDAGAPLDASAPASSSTSGGGDPSSSGPRCTCAVTPGGAPPWLMGLVGVWLLRRKR